MTAQKAVEFLRIQEQEKYKLKTGGWIYYLFTIIENANFHLYSIS